MAEQQRSLTAELEELLLVALGAVPGAILRWQLTLHLGDQNLLVNVLGAVLLGLLSGLTAAPRRQLLLGIGFCGSLTTFSGWMLDVVLLIFSGEWASAMGFLALTLGCGLGGALIGFLSGRFLESKPKK